MFTSVVFLWAMLYVTYSSFRWTIRIGDVEYGLCRMKSWLYIACGSFENRLDIHPYVAAAIITIAISLPSIAFLLFIRKLMDLNSSQKQGIA